MKLPSCVLVNDEQVSRNRRNGADRFRGTVSRSLCSISAEVVRLVHVTNLLCGRIPTKIVADCPIADLSYFACPSNPSLMPARSIASATISFGLVSVPVNLYSSAESKASISFNMLHKKCSGRLKQQYICPKDNNEVVERAETVKGYEFSKDQYVVFTPDELKTLEEKSTNMIDVIEFIPLAQVQREYVDKVYYLGPDKGGDRAYRLLTEALMDTGRAALGQYSSRGRQYLVLLRPVNGILAMETLHYADEVRSTNEVPVPEGQVKPQELALARQLI